MSSIQVTLTEHEKWLEFHPSTEMIVTKSKGRVIFPHLSYQINGLQPNAHYRIHLHLERVDDKKYKFEGGWKEASKGDPVLPIVYKEHPEGARTGEHWMKGPVSFSTLKLTNDPANRDEKCILVQSLHKYQPVLTVTQMGGARGEEFRLGLTEFITVTAYQSEEMIRLKVKHNKYASGFRPTGKRRTSSDVSEAPDAKRESPFSSSFSTSSSGTSSGTSSASGSPVLRNQNSGAAPAVAPMVAPNAGGMHMPFPFPPHFQHAHNPMHMPMPTAAAPSSMPMPPPMMHFQPDFQNQMQFQHMLNMNNQLMNSYQWYGYHMNQMQQFGAGGGALPDWNNVKENEPKESTANQLKPIDYPPNHRFPNM